MDQTLINNVISILSGLGSEKPWMTAAGLSRKIRRRTNDEISSSVIEEKLIEHSKSPGRKVRYSYYPSKRTLDILWGHVGVVGEKKNLPDLTRIDEPEAITSGSNAEKWFFISHNYRDLDRALEIRKVLCEYNFGSWLFETDIPEGGMITPLVKQAIGDSEYFVSYVTRWSIGSLWVYKEIEEARRGKEGRTLVTIDGSDEILMKLFQNWTGEWPSNNEPTEDFCRTVTMEMGSSPGPAWESRCHKFMDSLHDYFIPESRVFTFPAPSDEFVWHGKRLKMQPLDEYIFRLAHQD